MVRGAALVLALLLAPAAAAPATYYVDNGSANCSPTGPGTEAQPYCTIGAAITAHNGPGVTILVKPGTYREQVSVPSSGLSGNPFVIRALGSPVTVDGSDDFSSPGQWTPHAGDVYQAASVTWSPLQVFKDGARLTASTAPPDSLPSGAFVWVSGQGLYVNIGGDNPGDHTLLVGRRSYGFRMVGRSWITLEGFRVSHTESRGIYLNSGCSDLTVSRDTVTFANSYGIQGVSALRTVIEYCQTSDNHLHGIGLTQNASDCIVRFNESMRNADPVVRRANGIYLNAAPDNVLHGNRLHNNQDTGVHFSSGSNDCVSYNNRSWNNGDHGYDHLYASGIVHVHDVAFGNHKDGFSIEGSSPDTRIFNSIAVDNGLTTSEFDLWVNNESSVGFVSDHNIFWNSTGQEPFKYIDTRYATLAAYQAASDQDTHSLQANPMFVNGPAGDFRLHAGSPAIDAANSEVPEWPATDAQDSPRVDDPATADTGEGTPAFGDRGALEFLPPVDHAPTVVAPDTVSVQQSTLLTVTATASDPDGDPIDSLTATGLPEGATFSPGPGHTTGTLSWTPGFAQAGSYVVSFVASNALSGADTTVVTVGGSDRAPIVQAPADVSVAEGDSMLLVVTAYDPDGDPIDALTCPDLPPGATFTADPGDTTGTFRWLPGLGQAGVHAVSFCAGNTVTGSDTTVITVTTPVGVSAGAALGPPLVPRVAPDPFRDRAHLHFTITQTGPLRVQVFDLAGRVVRTLVDASHAEAGEYDLTLEARGQEGLLAQGLYFYRIQAAEGSARGRFLILR